MNPLTQQNIEPEGYESHAYFSTILKMLLLTFECGLTIVHGKLGENYGK